MGKNSEEISRTLKLAELLVFDYEKKYISEIDVIIETTKNYNQLSTRIDSINKVILDDDREMFKTPILLYSETFIKSYEYWAPDYLGGSGNGQNFLGESTAKSVATADGKAAAVGFIGLAAYGSWGVIFGPATFALGGAAVVCVAVNAALASGLEAASS